MIVQITRRSIALILFKRWNAIAAFLVGTAFVTAAYLLFVPREYISAASIFIQIDPQSLTNSVAVQGQPPPQPTNQNIASYIINSHIDMLESEDVVRTSLLKLGVDKVYPTIAKKFS